MSTNLNINRLLLLKRLRKYIKVLLLLYLVFMVMTLVYAIITMLYDTFTVKLCIVEVLECIGLGCIAGLTCFIDRCIAELEKGSR